MLGHLRFENDMASRDDGDWRLHARGMQQGASRHSRRARFPSAGSVPGTSRRPVGVPSRCTLVVIRKD